MANYKVELLDLTEPADRRAIVQPGVRVANVDVVEFPEGTDLRVHFGQGDGIPVSALGQSFLPCPPELDGVAVSHGAQAGVSVRLLIGFAADGLRAEGP